MSEYKIRVPRPKIPKRFVNSPARHLRKKVINNAEQRGILSPANREEYLQRIDHEIAVFDRCSYIEYLLGVLQLIDDMQLPYIAGRGVYSASLVLYCLNITHIDPIKHNLMFARFMPADKPKFIELELLIDKRHIDKHIQDLEKEIEYDEKESHCVILIASNIATLIRKASYEIWSNRGLMLNDMANGCDLRIPLDDVETYCALHYGNLAGVYFLNSRKLVNVIYYNRPTSFEDLVRLCAINRSGSFEEFNDNDSPYCYQEEIMREAMACGFSESEADELRRAVGRKQVTKLEKYRSGWVAKYGEASWDTMTEQGLWSYPKAHAVVLAYLAYTTAYLKIHFPDEFTRAALCVAASEDC